MTNTAKWVVGIVVIIVVVGLAVWWSQSNKSTPANTSQNQEQTANQTPTPPKVTGAVKLSSKEGVGNFLVDSNGMTLYYFAKDSLGKSNCSAGPCLNNWPIYSQSSVVAQSPLLQTDFAQITRDDGAKQTTYKGWPVYYFVKDAKPGDTLGIGVLNTWDVFPNPFYTVMFENQDSVGGNYLVDPKGMALYTFTKDKQASGATPPVSNCTAACLKMWPVFNTSPIIAPSSELKNSDFTSFKRADGATQTAYKGWPLYYYATDTKPGDVLGQNFNKVWFVAKP
jgi:predicted lipoprotein with Yx(FWY)xxD motif